MARVQNAPLLSHLCVPGATHEREISSNKNKYEVELNDQQRWNKDECKIQSEDSIINKTELYIPLTLTGLRWLPLDRAMVYFHCYYSYQLSL